MPNRDKVRKKWHDRHVSLKDNWNRTSVYFDRRETIKLRIIESEIVQFNEKIPFTPIHRFCITDDSWMNFLLCFFNITITKN